MSTNEKCKHKKKIITPLISSTATVVAVATGVVIYNTATKDTNEVLNNKSSHIEKSDTGKSESNSNSSLEDNTNNISNSENVSHSKPVGSNVSSGATKPEGSNVSSGTTKPGDSDDSLDGNNLNEFTENETESEIHSVDIDENSSLDNLVELVTKVFGENNIDVVNNKVEVDYSEVNLDVPGIYKVRAFVMDSNGDIIARKVFRVVVKETKTNVTLKEFTVQKKYLEKKETFNIDLELETSNDKVSVESVIINDNEYPVSKVKDKNILSKTEKYTIEMNSGDIAGVNNYKITKVKMSDKSEFDVEGNVSVDVLRDEARVNNFTFEDLGESDKLKVGFNLDDKDSAVTQIRGVLYDSQGTELQSKKLKVSDKNEVEFENVPGNNTYTFKVFADMDLDSNKSNNLNEITNKELLSEKASTKKTVIEGENVTILEGQFLNAKEDLSIRALDKDGNDITSEVEIDDTNVNIHVPGEYKVIASVTNSIGKKVEKEFTVNVEKTTVKAKVNNFAPQKVYLNRNSEFVIDLGLEISKKYVSAKKVTINDVEYNLEKAKMKNFFSKDENYTISMTSENTPGVKSYNISKIRMDDGTLINVDKTLTVEVLKQQASAEIISYEDLGEDGKINIKFNLNDTEDSITELRGEIYNLDGTLIESKKITPASNLNSVEFDVESNKTHTFKLLASMDLDTNTITSNENEVSDVELLVQNVSTTKKRIELKDIQGIQLYKEENGNTQVVDLVDLSQPLDITKYFVEIKQKDMPVLMAPLKSYEFINNELEFTVDYPNLVQFDEKGNISEGFKFKYNFKDSNNNVSIQNIQGLKAVISKNLSGTINLNKDIDAGYYTNGSAIITDEFRGTLNGNGHKIYNLKIPFFNSMKNATIKHLIIDNVNINTGSSQTGALANLADSSRIEDVHVNGKISGNTIVGGIIGLDKNCTLDSVSADVNINVGSAKTGGLIGKKESGGEIKNSYALGTIVVSPPTTHEKVGGLVGDMSNGNMVSSFSGVNIESKNSNKQVGGLLGSTHIYGTSRNSISFGNVINGLKLDGDKAYLNRHTNDYEYEEATGISVLDLQNKPAGINVATKANKEDKSFYINTLKWDENIWDLDGVSSGNYPTLKNNDPRGNKTYRNSDGKTISKARNNNNIKNIQSIIQDKELHIPNIERISKMDEFDQDKLVAYHNMYKLMPHYESEYLVKYGNKIDQNHELNTKIIKSIIPLKNKDIQLNLTTESYNDINKIMVIYKDKTRSEFNVNLDRFREDSSLVDYKIEGLDVIYSPNKFVTKVDESIVSELKDLIDNMTFDNVLEKTVKRYEQDNAYTVNGDPTFYKLDWYLLDDTYNELKKKTLDNLYSILSSVDGWNITSDNALINNKIKEEFENQIATVLLSKTYIDKWYDIDIGDIKLSEVLYSYPEVFGNCDTRKIINVFKSVNREHLKSDKTGTFYSQYLGNILGYNKVNEFVASAIKIFDGTDDPRDWFTNNFPGYLVEVQSKVNPNIEYRAWNALSSNRQFSDGSMLLPVLTIKDKSIYLISTVGPISIGVRSLYQVDDATFEKTLNDVSKLYSRYFDSIIGVSNNIEKNIFKLPSWDTLRYGQSWINLRDTKDQGVNKVYKSLRILTHPKSQPISGAFANGNMVRFMSAIQLDTGNSYNIWTHENAHNMDGIYLGGYGRRNGLWAEDFATGFFQEEEETTSPFIRDEYYIGWNWGVYRTQGKSGVRNASPDRVDTKEELQSYMYGVMDALYVLDLIEVEAVLSLTPEEQSKILHKYEYGKSSEYSKPENQRSLDHAHMRRLSADEIRAMNLRTYEDFVENRIVIERSLVGKDIKPNDYNGASVLDTSYYHGFVPNKRPDNRSLKRMAMELLAEKGWTDGVEGYMSNKHNKNNDQDVLNAIYNTTNFDFEEWKKDLYKRRYDKLNSEGLAFLDKENIKQQFINAYKSDDYNQKKASGNVRVNIFKQFKNKTNDFTTSIFGSVTYSDNEEVNEDINEEDNIVDGLEKLPTDVNTDEDVSKNINLINNEFITTTIDNYRKYWLL